jgi:integrase
MPIRKDADGRWHAEACVQRRRLHRRLPPGASASDAKRLEAELTRALHQPGTRSPSIPGDPLLTALLADYTERHVHTLRSPTTARYHALRIGRWCEGRRASEARQVAAAIAQDMHGHYAPATVNRSLGALKKALRMAWERGAAPVDYSGLVKRLPENNARSTWLTLKEVQAVADHASEPVRAAIWISVLTGCRRGEVLALRPGMIGREAITLPAGATKTLRTREVPIIAPLRPWLAKIGPEGLGINFEGLKSGFRRAREAAGMPHVTFHDLRRSCGTLLIQRGVSLNVVSRILGHSSTTVTERVYAHLGGKQLRAGLNELSALHRDLHRKGRKAA